jgi:hypothetical protein
VLRIRIRGLDPDPAFHLDLDPDPTFHSDADSNPITHFSPDLDLPILLQNAVPDPDPASQTPDSQTAALILSVNFFIYSRTNSRFLSAVL